MVKTSDFSDTLKKLWERIRLQSGQNAPFYADAWHTLWFRTIGTDWKPYILVASERVIAPFARNGDTVIFSGGREGTDYIDLIGKRDDAGNSWPEIVTFLKEDGIKKLNLFNIPDGSPTTAYFQSNGALITQEDVTPVLSLPTSWSAYVKSLDRKHRHELVRKIRKFEREHSQISIKDITDPAQQSDILLRLMRLDERKRRFLTAPTETFFREIIRIFQDQIWMPAVSINGAETSVIFAFTIEDEVLLYNSGFDQAVSPGAGFYLKARSIELSIGKKYKKYNFLQGGERYKYELGGKDAPVWKIETEL